MRGQDPRPHQVEQHGQHQQAVTASNCLCQ
jgi:hypothetical protein